MRPAGAGRRRLTVVLGAREHAHHHLLATELLDRARRAPLSGATLVEVAGTTPGPARPHGVHGEPALALVVVDEAEALDRFLHDQRALLAGTAVFLDDVEAFRAEGPR